MIETGLLWFVGMLVIANIWAAVYSLRLLIYSMNGLKFLEHVYGILLKNEEPREVELLRTQDAPIFAQMIISIRNVLYFIFLTICINFVVGLFALFPMMMLTSGWTIMIWTAAIGNAFVLISIRPFSEIKYIINATCESYNVLIQSFEHIKEYEENNNDSVE